MGFWEVLRKEIRQSFQPSHYFSFIFEDKGQGEEKLCVLSGDNI